MLGGRGRKNRTLGRERGVKIGFWADTWNTKQNIPLNRNVEEDGGV
jgi:hypothetical protein